MCCRWRISSTGYFEGVGREGGAAYEFLYIRWEYGRWDGGEDEDGGTVVLSFKSLSVARLPCVCLSLSICSCLIFLCRGPGVVKGEQTENCGRGHYNKLPIILRELTDQLRR